jgi:hypothetical protein
MGAAIGKPAAPPPPPGGGGGSILRQTPMQAAGTLASAAGRGLGSRASGGAGAIRQKMAAISGNSGSTGGGTNIAQKMAAAQAMVKQKA